MMQHLTSEQISESILGEPDPRIAEHLENCPACRAELGNFREALGEFRGAVRCWSENQAQAALAVHAGPSESRSWVASHQLALALLLAAVCILTSILWHPRQNALSERRGVAEPGGRPGIAVGPLADGASDETRGAGMITIRAFLIFHVAVLAAGALAAQDGPPPPGQPNRPPMERAFHGGPARTLVDGSGISAKAGPHRRSTETY